MMMYSCHPEVMMTIQRWLVDSLRASVGLKRSHDVRRESTRHVVVSATQTREHAAQTPADRSDTPALPAEVPLPGHAGLAPA